MQTTHCPSIDELQRLAIGAISDEAAEPLERHLLECPECIDRMGAVAADDTLLNALKAPSTVKENAAEESDVLRQLVSRLGEMSHVTLSTQLDLTDLPLPPGEGRGEGALNQHSFLAPAELPDEIGRLGGYRVLRVLGSGGMGVVFEAEDPRLKRHVALKVMKPDLAARVQSRQRFLREAQAMAALEHDHIVTIYQVGEDAGVPFLAMQFLQGESLADRLSRASGTRERAGDVVKEDGLPSPSSNERDGLGRPSTLPLDEALRIGSEIAEGLAAAHEHGLIHRDIKPGNIWLETTRGRTRVKILDFGLARVTEGAEELTHSAAVLGTPSYMAPEQARGEHVDARADLFSVGCVLYRMTTGQAPFKGNSPLTVLMSLAIATPSSPRELNPDITSELNDLILSLLSKDPSGRPQSAREVADRLDEIERLQASGVRHQEGSGDPEGAPVQGSGTDVAQPGYPLAGAAVVADAAYLPLPAGPPGEGRGEGGLREASSSTAHLAPARRIPPRRLILLASAAAALLAGIVIVIKNEKGETVARIESKGEVDVSGLGPGLTFSAEATPNVAPQNTENQSPKTQDLSPKTSASNPKSKIQNRAGTVGPPTRPRPPSLPSTPRRPESTSKHGPIISSCRSNTPTRSA